jgi:hypothetical protein
MKMNLQVLEKAWNFLISLKVNDGIARPQVADGGDEYMEGSCEYIE